MKHVVSILTLLCSLPIYAGAEWPSVIATAYIIWGPIILLVGFAIQVGVLWLMLRSTFTFQKILKAALVSTGIAMLIGLLGLALIARAEDPMGASIGAILWALLSPAINVAVFTWILKKLLKSLNTPTAFMAAVASQCVYFIFLFICISAWPLYLYMTIEPGMRR